MASLSQQESEVVLQLIMQEREGGERKVETPIGYVDLLTHRRRSNRGQAYL